MKREELKELGLEKDVIDKIMNINGKDIENFKKEVETMKQTIADKEKEIEDKDKSVAELNETIKNFQGNDETIADLKKKIEGYEKAERDRKQAEKDKILTENILEIIGDKEFVNDYTKNSIIAQIKEDLAKPENKGKGTKDIFESLTKDSEGIFKNPQHDKLDIPPTGKPNNESTDEAFVRQVMGLPPLK